MSKSERPAAYLIFTEDRGWVIEMDAKCIETGITDPDVGPSDVLERFRAANPELEDIDVKVQQPFRPELRPPTSAD